MYLEAGVVKNPLVDGGELKLLSLAQLAPFFYKAYGRGAFVVESNQPVWYSTEMPDAIGYGFCLSYNPLAEYLVISVGESSKVFPVSMSAAEGQILVVSPACFSDSDVANVIIRLNSTLKAQSINRWKNGQTTRKQDS